MRPTFKALSWSNTNAELVDQVKRAVEQGEDPDESFTFGCVKMAPLIVAACVDCPLVVECLVNELKVDVNVETAEGMTALMSAAENGSLEIVNALAKSPNLNLEHKDKGGMTALHFAVSCGNVPVVRRLLCLGANVNTQDNDGVSALGEVVCGQNDDLASLLLRAGSNINLSEPNGNTPFLRAVRCGNVDLVTAMLDHQPDFLSGLRLVRTESNEVTPLLEERAAKLQKQVLAFLGGFHQRLGQDSAVNKLSHDVLVVVLNHFVSSRGDAAPKKLCLGAAMCRGKRAKCNQPRS